MASRRGKKDLTPEQVAEFMRLIRYGLRPAQAAHHIGVTKQAIDNRLKRSAEFHGRTMRAEAESEMMYLGYVIKACPKNWQAAMAILACRWPERYGKEIRSKAAPGTEGAPGPATPNDVDMWKAAVETVPSLSEEHPDVAKAPS